MLTEIRSVSLAASMAQGYKSPGQISEELGVFWSFEFNLL